MSIITSTQYKAALNYALKVQQGVFSLTIAAEQLAAEELIGSGSAKDYLVVLRAMLNGSIYKRTIKIDAYSYYLEKFYQTLAANDFGRVIQAIELHLDYYSELGKGNQPSVRALVNTYKAKLASQAASPIYPDEVFKLPTEFTEGAVRQVTINAYERNSEARTVCIAKLGAICQVCDFDFEKTYGEIGKGFIHVHHKVDLATIGESYQVDPINDLIPVCPNCHAMLHTEKPAMDIETLRQIIQDNALF
ncbi:HNH endonuclease [Shewanella sp. HL-SH5]|uniref:HNH endonuclease n=1 Tax=Shewanella sp. HL-SH5 TaxID=3436241 RepID=UPI003EBE18E4